MVKHFNITLLNDRFQINRIHHCTTVDCLCWRIVAPLRQGTHHITWLGHCIAIYRNLLIYTSSRTVPCIVSHCANSWFSISIYWAWLTGSIFIRMMAFTKPMSTRSDVEIPVPNSNAYTKYLYKLKCNFEHWIKVSPVITMSVYADFTPAILVPAKLYHYFLLLVKIVFCSLLLLLPCSYMLYALQ